MIPPLGCHIARRIVSHWRSISNGGLGVSNTRPVRRLARGVVLLALAFTLMGNGGWACGPFGPGANGRIPDADLDLIGTLPPADQPRSSEALG